MGHHAEEPSLTDPNQLDLFPHDLALRLKLADLTDEVARLTAFKEDADNARRHAFWLEMRGLWPR